MRLCLVISMCFFFSAGLAGAEPDLIRVDGSSTLSPLIFKAAKEFRKPRKRLRIVVSHSNQAVERLANNQADVAMVDQDLEKPGYKRIPLGLDAAVPVVSAEVFLGGVNALTQDQLDQIFAGTLKNWKDVGGPDLDIQVIDAKNKPRKQIQVAVGSARGAISTLSYTDTSFKVRALGLKTKTGVIYPTKLNLVNRVYPGTRPLSLMVRGEPKGVIKEFVDYVASEEGKKMLGELGFTH